MQPVTRQLSERTFFFTDRSLYRPGQTVYFKGLILETDGTESRIRKNQKTTVRLFDVNGQEKSSLELVSNDYGTFQGTFIAPASGMTGQMSINNESGSVGFSVEEYKRPKFEVVIDPPVSAYRLGEEVTVSGKATTYSGAAVDGASVQYKVTRRMRWIEWPWYKSAISPAISEVTMARGRTSTDGFGKFTVKFEARPDFSFDESSDPSFIYTSPLMSPTGMVKPATETRSLRSLTSLSG
jgi:uncharacterized protein YfaS (alpha-2-macroglobulin family)